MQIGFATVAYNDGVELASRRLPLPADDRPNPVDIECADGDNVATNGQRVGAGVRKPLTRRAPGRRAQVRRWWCAARLAAGLATRSREVTATDLADAGRVVRTRLRAELEVRRERRVERGRFRRALDTARHCQFVVMALKPKEEIGAEVHTLDQFFRVEAGTGEAVLDGVRTAIRVGFAVVVPAGTHHNIINTGNVPLKLDALDAPPNHRAGGVHPTRADAEADTEHFDGKMTEEGADRVPGIPLRS